MNKAKLANEVASYNAHRAIILRCEEDYDRSNPRHVAEAATYPQQIALIDDAIAKLQSGISSLKVAVEFWDAHNALTSTIARLPT